MEYTPGRIRVAFVLNDKLEILCFVRSDFTPSSPVPKVGEMEHIGKFLADAKSLEQLQSAMSVSMFNHQPQETDVVLINGESRHIFVQRCYSGLWLITSHDTRRTHDFTERQHTIIEQVANDITIQQIAKELGLTQSAVQSHLAAARAKSGFDTTAGLVAWCVENKFVTIHDTPEDAIRD